MTIWTAAADRQIMILNVPDYGTTEVADHAMTLALSLRRGLLHHETQREPWTLGRRAALLGPHVQNLIPPDAD